MQLPDEPLWWPAPGWRQATVLGELMDRLDVPGYDALLRLSLEQPQRYWQAVQELAGWRWREPPTAFMATPQGPALPDWFPGGRLNWVDMVLRHAHGALHDQPALIAEDEPGEVQVLDWRRLRDQVLRCAAGLRLHGVARGDRVGLMMPMGVPAVVSLLAIAALGAVAVPLFSGFAPEAAAARLQLAGARWLVASASFWRRRKRISLEPVLRAVADALPQLQLVVDGDASLERATPWSALLAAAPLAQAETMEANDPWLLVFTSGTTGQPKGTVHTHAGFPLKIAHDAMVHFDLRAGDRWLWPSDMGWIVGPITVAGALGRGATLVCYDGAPDVPDAARFAELVDHHRVTHFGASPTLVRSLAASGVATRGASLASLKLLMVAGEPIDPEHFGWFFRAFGGGRLPLINYTGGTEASGALLASVPARPIKACGFNSVSPGVAAHAGDAQGQRLRGTPGELLVRQPFIGMTRGFWNDPQRYLDAYWSQLPGAWSHGDLVLEDADGHFFVLGRSDDTLKIAGKRVGPAEVEDVVLRLDGVKEAVAVGLPDGVKGQRLVVCVVPRDGAAVDANAVATRVEAALGKPFRPAAVHVVDELPRTRNGKAMRRVVRQVLAGQPAGDLTALDNPQALDALRRAAP
ncbi:MAG: AMP-binding protein [Pseudomonadota bacterium]